MIIVFWLQMIFDRLMVTFFALMPRQPLISLASMTVSGWVMSILPVYGVRFVPLGTPVFVGPGHGLSTCAGHDTGPATSPLTPVACFLPGSENAKLALNGLSFQVESVMSTGAAALYWNPVRQPCT